MEWYKGDVRTIWIRSLVTYASMVHSTWPSRAIWQTHAPTFNKWHKKKKVTLRMLTHDAIQGCGLTSWVVCIDNKSCDIRERNVTIRSEIWTTNIRSLGFRDIRGCVTLWRLLLQSLGCIMSQYATKTTTICYKNHQHFEMFMFGSHSNRLYYTDWKSAVYHVHTSPSNAYNLHVFIRGA
jgi:hypothetical protein